MRPSRTRARQVVLQRQLLLAVRRAGQPASEPAGSAMLVALPQQDADGPAAEVWRELTARQVALCRRDRQRWAQAMNRADALQAQGLPPIRAVRQALDEAGA